MWLVALSLQGSSNASEPAGVTAWPAQSRGPIAELDLRTLYLKDLALFGCTVLEPEVFPNLVCYIERGEIKPLLAETYSLFDIAQAQEAFLTKRHVGKIVLTL